MERVWVRYRDGTGLFYSLAIRKCQEYGQQVAKVRKIFWSKKYYLLRLSPLCCPFCPLWGPFSPLWGPFCPLWGPFCPLFCCCCPFWPWLGVPLGVWGFCAWTGFCCDPFCCSFFFCPPGVIWPLGCTLATLTGGASSSSSSSSSSS